MTAGIENINRVPLRVIKIVLDLDDPFGPELTLEDFIRYYNALPQPPRYKIVSFEIVTCTEDNQPVLITECGQCNRFIRRFDGEIYCKGFSSLNANQEIYRSGLSKNK